MCCDASIPIGIVGQVLDCSLAVENQVQRMGGRVSLDHGKQSSLAGIVHRSGISVGIPGQSMYYKARSIRKSVPIPSAHGSFPIIISLAIFGLKLILQFPCDSPQRWLFACMHVQVRCVAAMPSEFTDAILASGAWKPKRYEFARARALHIRLIRCCSF